MNNDFIIERTFDVPSDRVWKAITDGDEMKKWYFDFKEFRTEVGFEFRFFGGPEDRQYEHVCVIREVIPQAKLSYSWRYEGYKGDSLVTFELFPDGDKTTLRLTHSGLDTIAVNGPDFARENFAGGWTELIGTLLKNHVENKM
jgi:uncharacterized protein YndB with AHSA1/START domain